MDGKESEFDPYCNMKGLNYDKILNKLIRLKVDVKWQNKMKLILNKLYPLSSWSVCYLFFKMI